MSLSPVDWSVVVVGRWNRAILTPAGIGKRLFGLPEGTPLEVMLAIDAIAPPRVSHEGIVVVAGSDRLVIQPQACTYAKLDQARSLAKTAINDLRETPVSGIGVNIKYKTSETVDEISNVLACTWDDLLSDNGYTIHDRTTSRSLKWRDGSINVSLSSNEDGEQLIQFNFDKQSPERDSQGDWLSIPIADLETEVKKVLIQTIELDKREFDNDE